VLVWYIFARFGILCLENSGNPDHNIDPLLSLQRPQEGRSRSSGRHEKEVAEPSETDAAEEDAVAVEGARKAGASIGVGVQEINEVP
jgi:hypothetical protein